MENAIAIFPSEPPEDRDARIEIMEDLELDDESFATVDDQYFNPLNSDDSKKLETITAAYCRAHIDEIWPEGFIVQPSSD